MNKLFNKTVLSLAYLGLLLFVPVLNKIDKGPSRGEMIILKGDVKVKLKERGLYADFEKNRIKCVGCHTNVNFDNLGVVKINNENVHLFCRDPGCTLKA